MGTKIEELPGVDLIATGYEWECPDCRVRNFIAESYDFVRCDCCGRKFKAEELHHAIGDE